MNEGTPLPSYNNAAEIEQRRKLIAQSAGLTVDKPGTMKPAKGMRIRNMRVTKKAKKRWNPKRPTFY